LDKRGAAFSNNYILLFTNKFTGISMVSCVSKDEGSVVKEA
jgi:hypothetical protein